MPPRFALRFESGERSGETISLAPGVFRVGRKPGNNLQLTDASVSGQHAELEVDETRCTLRDLGSTNGTRVAGQKIQEQMLASGDVVHFGNVRLVFLNTSQSPASLLPSLESAGSKASPPLASQATGPGTANFAPMAVASPAAPSAAQAGEAMRSISAESVARAGKRSPALALVGLALVVAGGALYWWLGRKDSKTHSAPSSLPVENPADNLLSASYSFENASSAWENDAQASAEFGPSSEARHAGALGLGARLEPGDYASAKSDAVSVGRARAVRLKGFVSAMEQVDARLWIEFSSATDQAAPWRASSSPAGLDWTSLELNCPVPSCYDTLRALVAAGDARSKGIGESPSSAELLDVFADDVSVVPLAGTEALGDGGPKVGETQLLLAGQPPSSGLLFRIDRALLTDIHALGDEGPAQVRLALSATAGPHGIDVRFVPAKSGGVQLSLWIERDLAAGGLTSMGGAGAGSGALQSHQSDFRRDDASSLVVGTGRDMLRLAFAGPTRIWGYPKDGRFHLKADLGSAASLGIQLSFIEEFSAANKLAAKAKDEESQGKFGAALASWTKLEQELPFEHDLLERAQAARARLVQSGWDEFQRLSFEAENARFFALPAVVRATLESAARLAGRYAGSEVAAKTAELERTLQQDLAQLEAAQGAAERARLVQIADVLAARGEKNWSARVRASAAQAAAPPPPSSP